MARQAQGGCSASQATTVAATLLVLLFLRFHSTEATSTFSVGDTSGWTYNIQSWTNGKQFKAGDTLSTIPSPIIPFFFFSYYLPPLYFSYYTIF